MLPRVHGILCPSYSGSSVLNYMLGGLGETHWIQDDPTGPLCAECYPDRTCPIFTPEVIQALQAPRAKARWWETLGSLLSLDEILTSDKAPAFYMKLGIPDAFIFPYKDPRAHVMSIIRHDLRPTFPDLAMSDSIGQALQTLGSTLNRFLDWAETTGRPVLPVKLELLALHKEGELQRICDFLDRDFDASVLEFWKLKHHHIRGNFSVRHAHHENEGRYYFAKSLKPDRRWELELKDAQGTRILEDPEVQRAHARLEALA